MKTVAKKITVGKHPLVVVFWMVVLLFIVVVLNLFPNSYLGVNLRDAVPTIAYSLLFAYMLEKLA